MTNGKLVQDFVNRIMFPGTTYEAYVAKYYGNATGALTFGVGYNTYTLAFSDIANGTAVDGS